MDTRLTYYATLFLLIGILPGTASARENYAEPRVGITATVDDNRGLLPDSVDDGQGGKEGAVPETDSPETVHGFLYSAGARLGSRTEVSDLWLDGTVRLDRYSDSSFDSDNYYLRAGASQETQRNFYAIEGGFTRASTLLTEFEDTGETRRDKIRESIRISPFFRRNLTQRTDVELTYAFRDESFRDEDRVDAGEEIPSDLRDFREHIFTTALNHRLSETTTVFGVADFLHMKTVDNRTEWNAYGLSIGVDHRFSPLLSTRLAVGRRFVDLRVREDDSTIDLEDRGPIYDAKLAWANRRTSIGMSVSRGVESTGRGELSDVKRASFTFGRELTSKFRLEFLASGGRRQYVLDSRDFYEAAPRLLWEPRPNWKASASYRYRWQNSEIVETEDAAIVGRREGTADSNAVFLTVGYTWPTISLSR